MKPLWGVSVLSKDTSTCGQWISQNWTPHLLDCRPLLCYYIMHFTLESNHLGVNLVELNWDTKRQGRNQSTELYKNSEDTHCCCSCRRVQARQRTEGMLTLTFSRPHLVMVMVMSYLQIERNISHLQIFSLVFGTPCRYISKNLTTCVIWSRVSDLPTSFFSRLQYDHVHHNHHTPGTEEIR